MSTQLGQYLAPVTESSFVPSTGVEAHDFGLSANARIVSMAMKAAAQALKLLPFRPVLLEKGFGIDDSGMAYTLAAHSRL